MFKRKLYGFITILAVILILLGVGFFAQIQCRNPGTGYTPPETGDKAAVETTTSATKKADKKIAAYAKKHNISEDEYPYSLRALLERNPETEDFVLEYPLKSKAAEVFNMRDYIDCDNVPLLMQWDQRWGYAVYGSDVMGITGCGPTCLSMVALYLLGDEDFSPAYVAAFSTENGYCVPGNGTSWLLMSEGAEKLGLDAVELPLDENRMINNLSVGNPIICVMGPGDFTDSGHYIVLTGYTDGKFTVNDPNSRARSEKLWSYDEIKDQIRNIWTYRVK